MNKKYLLFAATTALMFGACSDDINQGGTNTPPQSPNTLTLKKLDAASQAGRVSLPGQTRGVKADRLKLVAKIAPVAESLAAEHNWSATGIAIVGDNAYISWHSNHQATVAADMWGGALDVININALSAPAAGNLIATTLTSSNAKFNNVVADANNLYLPMTCYNNGAVVGRVAQSALGAQTVAIDTLAIPGSSANAISVDGSTLYAVSGYAGGVYSMPTDFVMRETDFTVVEGFDYAEDFGGKYIAGNYVLRTDDAKSQILNLTNGSVRNEGAPLISEEKYAEAYDPANDRWYPLTGEQAKHYGKHTMAVDGNYIYVGGGQGSNGENGLRVYAATGLVWQNGTNTTAVCVDENYVYAATGAGLRVYEKYNNADRDVKLFAYEVKAYDEAGKAIGYEAGTDAHSSNFVAVGGGYIFVACGQSGVYVFQLDETAQPQKTGFTTSTGIDETKEIEGENDTFTVPTQENVESWVDGNGTSYTPGTEVTLPAGTIIALDPVYKKFNVTFDLAGGEGDVPAQQIEYGKSPVNPAEPTKTAYDFAGWSVNGTPVNPAEYTVTGDVTFTATWKDHEYAYTLKFVGWAGKENEITNVPAEMKRDNPTFEIPDVTPVWGERNFCGWYTEAGYKVFEDPNLLKAGNTFTLPEGVTEYTLYGVWSSNMGGSTEEEPEPSKPVIGGEDSNGKG